MPQSQEPRAAYAEQQQALKQELREAFARGDWANCWAWQDGAPGPRNHPPPHSQLTAFLSDRLKMVRYFAGEACGLNLPATADVSSAMGLTRRLAAEVVLAGLVYRRRERGKRRQSP